MVTTSGSQVAANITNVCCHLQSSLAMMANTMAPLLPAVQPSPTISSGHSHSQQRLGFLTLITSGHLLVVDTAKIHPHFQSTLVLTAIVTAILPLA